MFKASKLNTDNKYAKEISTGILEKAFAIVNEESDRRKNKSSQFAYMKAMLTYEQAIDIYEEVLKKHKTPKVSSFLKETVNIDGEIICSES